MASTDSIRDNTDQHKQTQKPEPSKMSGVVQDQVAQRAAQGNPTDRSKMAPDPKTIDFTPDIYGSTASKPGTAAEAPKPLTAAEAPKPGTAAEAPKPGDKPATPASPEQTKALQTTVAAINDALQTENGDKLADLLQGKTQAERQQIAQAYQQQYHRPLADDISSRATAVGLDGQSVTSGLSDYDRDRGLFLLNRPDRGNANADKLDQLLFDADHGKDNAALEAHIRDTVSVMSSKQIQEQLDPQLIDRLKNDKNLSPETREALGIYSKGSDQRTNDDVRQLAGIALAHHNQDMFEEAMRGATPEARQAFRDNGPLQPELQSLIKTAQAEPDQKELAGLKPGDAAVQYLMGTRAAKDYAQDGRLSTPTEIGENVGPLSSNLEAMDQAVQRMTAEDKKMYAAGRQLANGEKATSLPDGKTEAECREYYDQLHSQLTRTAGIMDRGGSAEGRVGRLEEQILYPQSALMQRLSNHTGTFTHDSAQQFASEFDKMSDSERDLLKNNPDYRHQVEGIVKAALSEKDAQSVLDHMDSAIKGGADAQPASKPVLDELNAARTPQQVLSSLSHMTPAEIQQYKDGGKEVDDQTLWKMSQADRERYQTDRLFHQNVDLLTKQALSPGMQTSREGIDSILQARQSAKQILDNASKGNGTDATIAAATLPGGADGSASLKDLVDNTEKALQNKDLRDKLADPAHPEYRRQFEANLRSQMTKEQYDQYIKPMLAGNEVPLNDRVNMYDDSQKSQLMDDLNKRSPQDKQALLTALSDQGANSDLGKSLRQHLSADERTLLSNELKNSDGKPAPEDSLRALTLGLNSDSSAVRDALEKMTPEQRAAVSSAYATKYGHDLVSDIHDKVPGRDGQELERIVNDRYGDDQSAYQRMLDAKQSSDGDGFGRWVVNTLGDGTANMSDDAKNELARAMQDVDKNLSKLPDDQRQRLEDNMRTAITNLANSKGATADEVINGAITIASVAAAPLTGGVSLGGMLFAAGAAGAAGAGLKSEIMGNDANQYQFLKDAASFSTTAFFAAAGPSNLASILQLGKDAGSGAAKGAIESLSHDPALQQAIRDAGGEKAISDATTKLVQEALVTRKSSVSGDDLVDMAKKLTHNDQEAQQLAAAIQKQLQPAIDQASKNLLHVAITRPGLSAGMSGVGGASGAAVNGAANGDDVGTIAGNAARAGLISGALGGGVAAGFSWMNHFGPRRQTMSTNAANALPGPDAIALGNVSSNAGDAAARVPTTVPANAPHQPGGAIATSDPPTDDRHDGRKRPH